MRSAPPDPALEQECRALSRYLIGMDATDYVLAKYLAAHQAQNALAPKDAFDRMLLSLARGPGVLRALAASFARVHAPESALQAKLVTLLAILETTPPSATKIDTVPSANVPWLVFVLALRGGLASLSLVAGTVLLWPLRLALSRR